MSIAPVKKTVEAIQGKLSLSEKDKAISETK
jgi:hypothetical protein